MIEPFVLLQQMLKYTLFIEKKKRIRRRHLIRETMKNIQTLVKLSSWRTQIIDDIWPKPGRSSTMFKKFTHPTTKANAQENKLNSKIYCVNDGPDFTELLFRKYDFNEELARNYSKITKTLKVEPERRLAAGGALPSTP